MNGIWRRQGGAALHGIILFPSKFVLFFAVMHFGQKKSSIVVMQQISPSGSSMGTLPVLRDMTLAVAALSNKEGGEWIGQTSQSKSYNRHPEAYVWEPLGHAVKR